MKNGEDWLDDSKQTLLTTSYRTYGNQGLVEEVPMVGIVRQD